jgi:CHAT domain-containing protein
MQDKVLLDQQVPLDDQRRQAIATELSEVRRRLIEAERQLLPAAQPWELAEIRKQLREGEVLLVYGWSTPGVSVVALAHKKMGEEASAHWVSRVEDAPTPPETAGLERALIHRMNSVALLIATGLAPEAARAADVAKSLAAIQADAALVERLGEGAMNDVRRLAANLKKAADALTQDPPQNLDVPSMPIGSLGALARVLLDFALTEAIRPVLHRASRVIVAPSGPLHDLPLDVLVELANFAPLKNKPVTLVPSGSILALIRSRGGDLHRDGVTAVGDPDIELPGASRGGDSFHVSQLESLLGERAAGQGRLPRAKTESTLVASYWGGTPTIDSRATPSRLRAEAPRKRVVHIAAHAVLGAMDNPLTSAILLSREPSPDGHRTDGRLSVGDLITTWGDHLKGCELAVLSCCQTGRGVQVGDSVMALPIGLLHAGVNAIVASLWKVDDLATCLLMTRFHQNLLGDHRTLSGEIDQVDRVAWGTSYARGVPMPVPQALQEAKVWLKALPSMELSEFEAEHPAEPRYVMKNGKRVELATDVQLAQERAEKTRTPPFADPRYWAAFVVIGDCKLQATPTPPFVHITGA